MPIAADWAAAGGPERPTAVRVCHQQVVVQSVPNHTKSCCLATHILLGTRQSMLVRFRAQSQHQVKRPVRAQRAADCQQMGDAAPTHPSCKQQPASGHAYSIDCGRGASAAQRLRARRSRFVWAAELTAPARPPCCVGSTAASRIDCILMSAAAQGWRTLGQIPSSMRLACSALCGRGAFCASQSALCAFPKGPAFIGAAFDFVRQRRAKAGWADSRWHRHRCLCEHLFAGGA